MANTRASVGRLTGIFEVFLLFCVTLSAPVAGAQYPSTPQVQKDGTTLLLEDYASPPFSNPRKNGVPVTSIDFHQQLNRVNSLRSELAVAHASPSPCFVM